MVKACNKGLIQGVIGYLIRAVISHIQYADDTILMVDGYATSILNLNIILYYFEWLSGLKIKFHKSEIFAFGMDQQQQKRVANMFNCKLG